MADDEERGTPVDDVADGASNTLRQQAVGAFSGAARDILGPALQTMSKSAAEQVANYAKDQGPKLMKEQVLPQILKQAGVDSPQDLAKAGIGKAGDAVSGAGGITGIAGKLMSKIGGKGGKKGVATGYGQGRRIMVQQVQYIPVKVEDVYRAWTSSEWPEYMHRVNTLDRQNGEEEGDESRYSIGVKGLWFKKNFTAQVQEQVPFKFIVWSTTQGNIKNTGRVSFHGEGDDLTLMILNLDMAPSGLREKWVRGFRYHKRGIRSDYHRFAAWVQMRTQEQLDDMEGWLGTIEGGKITQTHEEYVEEHPEEKERGGEEESGDEEAGEATTMEAGVSEDEDEDTQTEEEEEEDTSEDGAEEETDEEEEDESDGEEETDDESAEEDEEEEEEPVAEEPPKPRRRSRARTTTK